MHVYYYTVFPVSSSKARLYRWQPPRFTQIPVPRSVANENSVQPTSDASPRGEPQSLSSLRPSMSLANEIRRCTGMQGSTVRTLISAPQGEAAQPGRLGLFRQPIVRSGDAVHRPATLPRRTPFPAAESLVARVSPSPMKDVFSIGDSNRNTNGGFVVTRFHGTRSHDGGIR